MSRFFAGASDESDNDNDQTFEEEEEVDQRAAGARFSAVTRHFESSSDEEDEKRVVKSEKDKRWEQMLSSIRTIRNHMKINDWQALAKDFDTLNKQLSSAKSVVAKEGIPKFYFRIMIALENFLNESFTAMKAEKTDTSGKKKFNALNAKALNAMKQKLRKNRTQYQDGYTAYEKDPLPDGDEETSEKPQKEKAPKKAADDDFGPTFEEEDEDDKGSESDAMSESSSDSDIDLDKEITRDFWLKKDDDFGKDEASKKEERLKRQQAREERRAARMLDVDDDEEEKKKALSKEKDIDYTPEMVLKKLTELLSKFGRRGTDKVAMIEDLTLLSNKAKDPAALVKVKTTLAAALFDANINAGEYMAVNHWKSCFHVLEDVIELLKVNPSVRLSEDEQIDETILDDDLDAEDVGDKPSTAAAPPPVSSESLIEERAVENAPPGQDKLQYVTGNLHSFITRLHLEYRKSLQYMDPHSPEYISRLQDEPLMVRLIDRAQVYYRGIGKIQVESGVSLLRMEYESYRYRSEHDALLKESKESTPSSSALAKRTLVDELAAFVYKQGDYRGKTRALLLHIYHMALHNRWAEARDLMLMSRIQDTVHDQDIRTRILFNRAMAQLGLCAFRVGEFRACLQCLGELFLSNKVKELLAQGVNIQRWTERDLEKEKQEKLRQLPYHMHLNMDALEGAHLVCAMLAEVPNMALHGSQNRRKVISKVFRRLFDHHSKQAFNGPPENTRELVMAATKALQKGDWARCIDYVNKMRLWDLVPNPGPIKEALSLRIREEGVKTYVLTYAGHYMSVGMAFLSQMFNLPERNVYKLLSTMMVNEQLQGAWDQPSNCLVMQSTEPSRLQRAALKYADRVSVFVEQNEKLLDQRGFYNKEERGRGDGERGQKKGWVDYRKDGRQGGGDRDRRGGNRNDRGGDRDRRPRENREQQPPRERDQQQQQQRYREDREEAYEADD